MSHESRRLWSWLIFDVGPKMRRRLLFLFAVLTARCWAAQVGSLDVWPADMSAWPWIRQGELYFIHFRSSGEGVHLYYINGAKPLFVTGLAELAETIRREVTNVEALKTVVRGKLGQRIADLMGPRNSWVLPEGGSLPRFRGSSTAALAALKKVREPAAIFEEGGKWRLTFFVAPNDGSIECWTVQGQLEPFGILDLSKARIEEAGTIPISVSP